MKNPMKNSFTHREFRECFWSVFLRFFFTSGAIFFLDFSSFFSSDYSHGFYLIWHMERKCFGSFFDKYTKTKDIFERDENSCSKNFQNSRISLLCLEFSKANQTRRTRFWFIWYLFWYCSTFFSDTKDIFFTNSRFEKDWTIFNSEGFRIIFDIFRIIMISAIFFLYFYVLLQIENIIHLFFCFCEKLNF